MGNNINYRLISKFMQNQNGAKFLHIGMVLSNGESRLLAIIQLPHDNQLGDDIECAEAISDALRKRIKKSYISR
jgi:hypothetical protein